MRTRDVSKLLLLCNLLPGGMILCQGVIYTSNFLDFTSINAFIIALSNIPVNPGEPPHNLPALKHLFHQHIPFKASL